MEAVQMEAQLFGTNAAEAEVANTEVAYEAALTEVLSAQAAEATTEAEAEAAIAATLPITITIMGGRRALRPVMPVMAQATGRLTRMLRQQGQQDGNCCELSPLFSVRLPPPSKLSLAPVSQLTVQRLSRRWHQRLAEY